MIAKALHTLMRREVAGGCVVVLVVVVIFVLVWCWRGGEWGRSMRDQCRQNRKLRNWQANETRKVAQLIH